jgi:hypothetical protein
MLNHVKLWLHGGGIVRSGKSKTEFMIFLLSVHQELAEKQKPPTHQGGGFQSSGGDFIQRVFLAAHRRELSFPIKGTLALHCQVARLVSESFLMLVRIITK